MKVDRIFQAFSAHRVEAILIGGMNFLLRHQPVLTFDIDFWVRDSEPNLGRTADALRELEAQWGATDATWGPLPQGSAWLLRQSVFCATSPYGAIDIFREVRGLEGDWEECHERSEQRQTAQGASYLSLSDADMLRCQTALPENERKLDRVRFLTEVLRGR